MEVTGVKHGTEAGAVRLPEVEVGTGLEVKAGAEAGVRDGVVGEGEGGSRGGCGVAEQRRLQDQSGGGER